MKPLTSFTSLAGRPLSQCVRGYSHWRGPSYGYPPQGYQFHAGSGGHGPLEPRHATTILCVRKGNQVAMVGDGQVTQGNTIIKPNARKLRKLQSNVIAGFAGATADCLTLVDRLEGKLEEYPGQLLRACVELAKAWRLDRYLRNLEAVMIVADEKLSLEVTGNGDVLESHDGILGVGSGGNYALAAARALIDAKVDLPAKDIALKAMHIAADMDIGTNHNFIVESIDSAQPFDPNADNSPASLPSTAESRASPPLTPPDEDDEPKKKSE
ncbi:unnamed protein product [Vitrella brassicaformis CCMP3155]|uniref:Uncharacterized protein n=2 Tax=Vitrella brassicaformis TaxID=1169539 RepID=A0A0G4H406_VITBC|nr:unnamed protein product [Vitrella brassicaformis CCMP3155]|eukprot:CEM38449.1 unnamed protein product [Vitrella brassicaformis CCMP3155]